MFRVEFHRIVFPSYEDKNLGLHLCVDGDNLRGTINYDKIPQPAKPRENSSVRPIGLLRVTPPPRSNLGSPTSQHEGSTNLFKSLFMNTSFSHENRHTPRVSNDLVANEIHMSASVLQSQGSLRLSEPLPSTSAPSQGTLRLSEPLPSTKSASPNEETLERTKSEKQEEGGGGKEGATTKTGRGSKSMKMTKSLRSISRDVAAMRKELKKEMKKLRQIKEKEAERENELKEIQMKENEAKEGQKKEEDGKEEGEKEKNGKEEEKAEEKNEKETVE